MEEAWGRVLAWLGKHAIESRRALSAPADADELAQVESQLAMPLPADLVALFSMTGGSAARSPRPEVQFASRMFPGDFSLLDVAQIPDTVQTWTALLAKQDEEEVGYYWHPRWVPLASHVGGDVCFIDDRPGPEHGRLGWSDHAGQASFTGGRSLSSYVGAMADALERDSEIDGYRPTVVAGRLQWDW